MEQKAIEEKLVRMAGHIPGIIAAISETHQSEREQQGKFNNSFIKKTVEKLQHSKIWLTMMLKDFGIHEVPLPVPFSFQDENTYIQKIRRLIQVLQDELDWYIREICPYYCPPSNTTIVHMDKWTNRGIIHTINVYNYMIEAKYFLVEELRKVSVENKKKEPEKKPSGFKD